MLKLKWKVYDMLSNEEIRKAFQNIDISRYDSRLSPEFCNAHYCELYFSPLYKRVLLCQEIFIFVLYNLVQ